MIPLCILNLHNIKYKARDIYLMIYIPKGIGTYVCISGKSWVVMIQLIIYKHTIMIDNMSTRLSNIKLLIINTLLNATYSYA